MTTTNLGGIAARGINDASPAVVVGDTTQPAVCQNTPVIVTRGFRKTLDSSALVILVPLGSDKASYGRDISTAALLGTIGYSGTDIAVAECLGPGICDLDRTAAAWGANPAAPAALAKINASVGGAGALGNNDLGDIVGSSYDSDGGVGCVKNATLWRAPNQTLVVLGDQPQLDVTMETIANAINNASLRQVVGVNLSTNTAHLWEEASSGVWQDVLDLDTAACDCGEDDFVLREALDINDSGWIVARGQAPPPGGLDHAYLLRRVSDCPADLNGDGQVSPVDLGILLDQPATTCTNCTDLCCACLGDLNGDCLRDRLDQMDLVGAYGPCPGFHHPCVPEGGAAAGTSIQDAVQTLGFASVAAYQSWLAAATEEEAHAMGLVLVAVLSQ